ncbi:MAG: hypothetical protein M3Q80_00605 [bacterium]|nr:hypothetical protein [bacterium]
MFFSHSKGELILILDVQSSIVRGTLVHSSEEHLPTILYTHNVPIAYKHHARSGYLVKMALKGVHEVINEVLKHIHVRATTEEIPKKISKVHYVLSSPWVVSQAKILSVSFKKDTAINRPYILNLIAEERAKLISGQGGAETKDITIIEEKVFDVRLNGYSVASWDNQETKELEVSFVASLAGGRMVNRFVEACDHAVHRSKVQLHSSLFLQHVGIQTIISDRSSYALIHVHGELTDVAIIHAHSCTFFGSYPFGIHTVVRTLAREANISEQSADSVLNMTMQGNLDELHAQKEDAIIENMKKGWISEFKKILKTSTTPNNVPHHVIISGASHEDFFVKSFLEEYPQTSLELLSLDSITPHIAYDSHAERLRLTGLYVIAISSIKN